MSKKRRTTMADGGHVTPQGIVRFKLTASLTEGGSAAAVLQFYSGGSLQDGTAITVYDERGIFSGDIGAEGYCVYMADSKHFEIIQLTCPA